MQLSKADGPSSGTESPRGFWIFIASIRAYGLYRDAGLTEHLGGLGEALPPSFAAVGPDTGNHMLDSRLYDGGSTLAAWMQGTHVYGIAVQGLTGREYGIELGMHRPP